MRTLIALATLLLVALVFPGRALAQAGPEFKLGFKALADQIPEVVGEPMESEHWGSNGDSLQQTSRGLMVWRKADNWTAFTDGATTWINGPYGLASRLNSQLFEWEKPAAPAGTPPPPQASPGLILYQADWSAGLDGWTVTPGWRVQDGMLINDGSTQNVGLVAPFQPPAADYAVQAEIQMVNMPQYGIFALLARGRHLGGIESWNYANTRHAYIGTTGSRVVRYVHDPGTTWHTYRFEVQGTHLRLLIDGLLMAESTDNSAPTAGRVGIWNNGTQINVRSFKVIAL